jgi:hypothetical protein
MKKNYTFLMGLITLLCMMWSPIYSKNANESMWSLICPDDVTVDCHAEIWDLSIYGNATYHDHNGYHSAGTPVVHYYLGGCGSGYVTRTWTIEDPYWNLQSCTQTITVGGAAFNASSIVWPQMVTVEGCNPNTHPDVTGKPTWVASECSMLGYSYADALYTVNADCKKILRKWTVIDWCQMNGGNGNYQNTWTFTQTIKIVKNEPPVVNCIKDLTVSASDCKTGKVLVPALTIDPSSCGGNFEITNNSPYATNKFDDLSGTYPVGTTKVTFTIKYGCGQKKTCLTNVTVKNDKAPVAVCIGSLSVALMGIDSDKDGINDQGMVELWAKDLNWKSYSTCNNYPLTYSFSKDPKEMSKVFTCDNIGKTKVRMYVTDSKGNQSFCEVELDVQNNGANIKDCKPKVVAPPQTIFSAKGNLKNIYGEPLKNVDMQLYDPAKLFTIKVTYDSTEVIKKDSFKNLSGYWLYTFEKVKVITSKSDTFPTTNAIVTKKSNDKGEYLFENVIEKGSNCTIKCPTYNAPLLNIDEADLDAMTSHLLGQKLLDANQLLAADLDQNGKINIDDMNILFNYIKGEITSFGDKSHIVVSNNNGNENWVSYSKVEKDLIDINFTALQLGDLVKEKGTTKFMNTEVEANLRSIGFSNRNMTSVYPNPFSNKLVFDINSSINQKVGLRLYDISGRIVLMKESNLVTGKNVVEIDANFLNSGMYIYQLQTQEGIKSGKVTKE